MSECQCESLKNQIIQLNYEKRQLEIEVAELKRQLREERLIKTKVDEFMKGE